MKKSFYVLLFLVLNIIFMPSVGASYVNGDLINTCKYYFDGKAESIDDYNISDSGTVTKNTDMTKGYLSDYYNKTKEVTLKIYYNDVLKNARVDVKKWNGTTFTLVESAVANSWSTGNEFKAMLLKCPGKLYGQVIKNTTSYDELEYLPEFSLRDFLSELNEALAGSPDMDAYYKYSFQAIYKYDGKGNSVTPSNDIYNMNARQYVREGASSADVMVDMSHTCTYQMDNGEELKFFIKVDEIGISYNGETPGFADFASKAREVQYHVEKYGKCPVTVCFHPGSNSNINGAAPYLSLSNDTSTTCPAVTSQTTNTVADRTAKANETFEVFDYDSYQEAQAVLDEFKDAYSNYLDCIAGNDADGKCTTEKTEFEAACGADSSYDTCVSKQNKLLKCMDNNYSAITYDAGCESYKTAYEEAYQRLMTYCEESGNTYACGMVTRIGNEYNLGEITCDELFGEDLLKFISTTFLVIQIGGILITIVYSMMDFLNAIAKGDDDAMKKSFKKLKTRLIVIVLLILLPTLIEFTLETFNDAINLSNTNPLCK